VLQLAIAADPVVRARVLTGRTVNPRVHLIGDGSGERSMS